MDFSKEIANKVIKNQVDGNALATMYPELNEAVMKDFSGLGASTDVEGISKIINGYKTKASFAADRIGKSPGNQKTINTFLPDIIKAKIAIKFLEQVNFAVQSGEYTGSVKFNLWDGTLLQKLLFKQSFQRKPVSMLRFKLIWPLIIKKKLLIPMVNKKGIYCFYSTELVSGILKLAAGRKLVEIGAGDGALTDHLNELGGSCVATDNYSWDSYITYPEAVEKLDAREALLKYNPQVVVCSWPPPDNNFEKYVFEQESVQLYIVIGTKNPAYSCNHKSYQKQTQFSMEYSERLSAKLLPPSKDNAVYIFQRRD